MLSKMLLLAFGLAVANPALAQPSDPAFRNATNHDVLLKLYPPRALAAREQGAVGFAVTLDKDGHPTECRVTSSSGFPLLDQETCQLITLHAVFQPGTGQSGSQVSTHEGVVNWKLPASAQTAAAPAAPRKVAEASEKMICKRVPATGSNVATERVCATRRDWDKARSETREGWDELQGSKGSTNGN